MDCYFVGLMNIQVVSYMNMLVGHGIKQKFSIFYTHV